MRNIKGLTRALNESGKFKYKPPEHVVDYLVIGGGVVGLAIAQRLSQRFPAKSTCLVERHGRAGEEISSRNSEVIHSGLYYPPESLKTRLCLRGRDMMYERCRAYNVPYKQVGKLVVAKESEQDYIRNLHAKSLKLRWPPHSPSRAQGRGLRGLADLEGDGHGHLVLPTELLSGERAHEMEPDLSDSIVAALWCPLTGIVDSHSFMESLEKDIIDSENGELVYSTRAVRVDPHARSNAAGVPDPNGGEDGWVVQVATEDSEGDAILARTLINASGLSSTLILNALLPQDSRIPMYYARGSYASYHGPGVAGVSHLIYPCPHTGPNAHAFQSLGTHLTFDLRGRVRFGPDIEWINPPSALAESKWAYPEEEADFWNKILIPDESRIPEIHQEVTGYLPDVSLSGLQPDYCGMRPKLVPPWGGFQDFLFRTDFLAGGGSTRRPMLSLLGIESPGLTSSLAVAEHVVEDILCGQFSHQ
ncbi:FAD dependent oxidoreductase [Macrolepiota fuliginosa MF-IS2]|uniref:L-2-hydroxyglutarate dehydrogenase, mitochondrial n=1 Tax=Macrolepiota fuliginosa MF-IS2 TaxID=1400762 RepID=A0A9P5XL85_9AGAR|nr:FAD dependent oxidoreductase [Macrolepiota fuliginosa MF-IS2]